MNMKEYAFGIDLGGTTAKVGLFTTAGALLEKWEVPTDTSNAGEHILGNLAKAVKDKMQENGITAEQVEGVGVGVPGPVLDSRIVPIVCANLGGWGERNVSIQLSGLLDGIKVLVGNDANVAALGEIWMGCAKGCRSAVMVTLGTGVGGGVIVNGRIIEGAIHGAGGEIGLHHRRITRRRSAAAASTAAVREYSRRHRRGPLYEEVAGREPDTLAPCAAPTLPLAMSLMPPVQAMHWPPVRWDEMTDTSGHGAGLHCLHHRPRDVHGGGRVSPVPGDVLSTSACGSISQDLRASSSCRETPSLPLPSAMMPARRC